MVVFWTRAYRREGTTMQVGVAIVRPGYVAFLPLEAAMGGAAQFAHGVSSARGAREIPLDRYPLAAWWSQGEATFDGAVHGAAHGDGGLSISPLDGDVVVKKHGVSFVTRASPVVVVALEDPPPPHLTSAWRRGVLPFDARAVAGRLALFCVVFTACVGGCAGYARSAGDPSWWWGALGWSVIPLLGWLLFYLRVREHRADLRARAHNLDAGPYR